MPAEAGNDEKSYTELRHFTGSEAIGAEKPLIGSAGVSFTEAAVNIVTDARYEAEGFSQGLSKYVAVIDIKSRGPRAAPIRSEAMKADFKDASVEAIESLPEDVVATVTASQYVYFYVMRSVGPSLFEEIDKSTEDAHAEMGGGKEVFKDFNHVVVIAGIGLVEVEKPLVIDRVGLRSSNESRNKTGVRPSRELGLICLSF